VSSNQRIHIIDAIRGFAVLGILFANIQSWSGYKFIPLEKIETLGYAHLDGMFTSLHLWIVDGKFYAIFSILFGVGFGLQYLKNRDRLEQFMPLYRRRLALLLLFGIAHALVWSGDILTLYALLAFVMILMRDLPTRFILWVAIGLLLFFIIPQALMLYFGPEPTSTSNLAHKVYPDATPLQVTIALGEGGWVDAFYMNIHNLYWRWLDFLPNGRISRVLGFFMLGFYLARSEYFVHQVHRVRWMFAWGVAGVALSVLAYAMHANGSRWAVSGMDLLAKLILVASQTALAFAFMSVIGVLYENSLGRRLLHPLTLIGKMAFTNYLMQSLVGVALFYGVGLGYFGSLGLAQLWLLALVIYSLQVLFSAAWLQLFRQGPVEWFWGCLTKKRFTANRIILAISDS
jgi:uncharacterized protein